MSINLQMLRTLVHKGKPLHITIHRAEDHYRVDNPDGPPCTVHHPLTDYDLNSLKAALRYYPSPVTIDGKPLQTLPFPDLAQVSLTTYTDVDDRAYSFRRLPDFPSTLMEGNTYIAGVCCYLHILSPDYPLTYHTPGNRGNAFWTSATKVELRPTWVINDDETKHLTAAHTGGIHLDPTSHLTSLLFQRAQTQAQRTMEHPLMPLRHQGQLHHYVLDPPDYPSFFRSGIPIIVHGTPAALEEGLDRSTAVTALHALYTTDQPLVPVQHHQKDSNCEHPVVSHIRFQKDPDHHNSSWAVARANTITMEYLLEGHDTDHPYRIPAPFRLQGEPWDIQASYVPGQVSKEVLSSAMALAYWDEDDAGSSWDDIKDSLSDLETRMYELVSADFDDPDAVFAQSLRRFANSHTPTLPAPSQPITVTSHDGKLTVTYIP